MAKGIFVLFVAVAVSTAAVTAVTVDEWKIDGNIFDLTNVHRPGATLRLSINGARVAKVTPNEASPTKEIHTDLDNHQQISIQHFSYAEHDTSEYEVIWKGAGPSLDHELCIHTGFNRAHWYSTYEEGSQHWPLDNGYHIEKGTSFTVNDFFHAKIGGILEHLLVSSDGFAVMLDHAHPWFLRRDPNGGDAVWCLSVSNQGVYPKLAKYEDNYFDIRLNIKASKNIRSAVQATTNEKIGQPDARIATPKQIPDERVLRSPIWSTWAEFKKDINEKKVMDYAHDIKSHGFPNSQVEIDDFWEHRYGDFSFDPAKFPDPKRMISELHKEGFRVTAWVYPFVNQDSVAYQPNVKHFIKDSQGHPVRISWWDGAGGYVDFTDPDAAKWYVDRLMKLRNDTGLDGYKFDAGELNYFVGKDYVLHDAHARQLPNLLTTRYVETCAKLGTMIEVRAGYRSQQLPIFVRMLDKGSDWTINNGLKTLVTTSLMMSLAGYHFNLPDMIGGNAYGPKPDEELYIRWVQANAFLPSLQFSIPPWVYDTKTVNLTKKFVDLHTQHGDLIVKLAHGTAQGVPIIRPMWWAEPDDARTFVIADQYMLGDDIVVAPVLSKGQIERKVYLPSGTWIDPHGGSHTGPTEMTVKAPLEELPYYKRKV